MSLPASSHMSWPWCHIRHWAHRKCSSTVLLSCFVLFFNCFFRCFQKPSIYWVPFFISILDPSSSFTSSWTTYCGFIHRPPTFFNLCTTGAFRTPGISAVYARALSVKRITFFPWSHFAAIGIHSSRVSGPGPGDLIRVRRAPRQTDPCSQEAGSNLHNPRRTNPSNFHRNRTRKSKIASLGGPRQRTSCHNVPGSGSTAPLHQKATRTTARPPSSGAAGKPATPTHIYKEIFGHHGNTFWKKSVLISPWWKLVRRVRFQSRLAGKTHPPKAARPYLRDFPFLKSRGKFWGHFFHFSYKSSVFF